MTGHRRVLAAALVACVSVAMLATALLVRRPAADDATTPCTATVVTDTVSASPVPSPGRAERFSTTAPLRDRVWGAFAQSSGASGTLWELDSLYALEHEVGHTFQVVSGFTDSRVGCWANLRAVAAQGRATMLSYDIEWTFADIVSGRHDAELARTAAELKAIPGPVYLRPFAEMNGNWSLGSVQNAHRHVSSHAQWIAAWRRIVGIYRSAGASNVSFIWCPHAQDDPATDRMELYWPGSEWVDVLGFDAYNWGVPWRSHQQTLADAYRRVTALDPMKPVWVCELASAEGAGEQSKGQWVAALMSDTGYPRIQALIWFSVEKERSWQMDSSAGSLAAFRAAWQA